MKNPSAAGKAVFENTLSITAPGSARLHNYELIQHDVLHFHRSIELGLCVRGSGFSEIGGREQRFSPGDLFLAFPFQHHRNWSDSTDGSQWKWAFLDPLEIAQLTGNNPTLCTALIRKIAVYGIVRPEEQPEAAQYAKALMDAIEENGVHVLEKAYARLTLLLIALAERSEGRAEPCVRLPSRFEVIVPLLNTVNAELLRGRQLTVGELSALCGIPVSTCRRIFQNTLGTPPKQYILSCAAQAAMGYLSSTDRSMTEIAEATGFSEISTFNRAFRAETGLSPTQYRARFAK